MLILIFFNSCFLPLCHHGYGIVGFESWWQSALAIHWACYFASSTTDNYIRCPLAWFLCFFFDPSGAFLIDTKWGIMIETTLSYDRNLQYLRKFCYVFAHWNLHKNSRQEKKCWLLEIILLFKDGKGSSASLGANPKRRQCDIGISHWCNNKSGCWSKLHRDRCHDWCGDWRVTKRRAKPFLPIVGEWLPVSVWFMALSDHCFNNDRNVHRSWPVSKINWSQYKKYARQCRAHWIMLNDRYLSRSGIANCWITRL